MFNIVLLEPEIPANTGNIGRTCLITNSRLHLIEPMGFILNDKNLKRAGMDYWHELDYVIYDSWRDFCEKNRGKVYIGGVSGGTDPVRDKTEAKAAGETKAVRKTEAAGGIGAEKETKAALGTEAAGKIDFSGGTGKTGSLSLTAASLNLSCLWMATTKAKKTYCEATFRDGDYIMFGKESAGIPEEILLENKETSIRIPMAKEMRSLNLSNSAAIILYEALRQNGFEGLEPYGQLHEHRW